MPLGPFPRVHLLAAGIACGALPATTAAQSPAPAPPVAVVIEHASILPMDRDTLLADHTVIVVGDRIAWVGPAAAARVPAGAQRIDGRTRFVIPGLADMHVHLEDVGELPRYVDAGVTTVRNMRGRPEHMDWRARIARGALLGPTIFTTGPSIGRGLVFGNPDHLRLRTEAEASALVREQRRAGYDMIKVLRRIEPAVYERLLLDARAARLPVVGHVVPEVGMARSLAAGQLTFEHAELPILGGDAARLDEGARDIARAGAWVGTILSARDGRCGPPTPEQRRIVVALRRARVRLLAGTDAGLPPIEPGLALGCELATLVAAGMSPYEALETATRHPGEFARLHLGQRVPSGTVTVGARADLLLLASDPRDDVASVVRPVGTMLRGTWRPKAR